VSLRCLVSAILAVIAVTTPPALAQDAGDVDGGRTLYNALCVTCHGFEGAGGTGPPLDRARLRRAPDDQALRRLINDGIPARGMPRARRTSDDEQRQLVAYVRSLGRREGPPPPGDPQRGARIYANLGCAGCHIINGQGSGFGPELSEIGRLRGADHLRQAIVDPGAALPRATLAVPARGYLEFLPVTVVQRDGGEVRGVRLNEDVFTIQLRDAGGRIHSFRKADVAAVRKERDASLMPGYATRVAGGDLDDLVAYLSSLGGAE